MKTLFGLVAAGVIVFACVRLGDAAWRHYQLEDAVEREARFGNVTTISQLRSRVVDLAAGLGVQLDLDDVTVEQRGTDTHVAFQYVEAIPLIPRAYTHNQLYEVSMTVQPMRPLVVEGRR